MKNRERTLKRAFDLICSSFTLVLIFPVMLIIGVLIKCDSRGAVFFKQQRIGKYGKIFYIYKFRTMVNNAEFIGDGLSIKTSSDTRITKIGRILRHYSLDELPQFINVMLGDMSLVGPRPPVTYHPYDGYDNYPAMAKKRFTVKPGITGLAQITYRNSSSWERRITLDCEYVDKFSFKKDIQILLHTVIQVIKPGNIY